MESDCIAKNSQQGVVDAAPVCKLSITSQLLEYGGAILGMAGSLWMASGIPSSRLAWWVWLVSNAMLVVWSFRVRARAMLAMQLFYFFTSLVGVVRH